MMRRLHVPFAKLLVVVALFVAMAGTGFAHRFAAEDMTPQLRAYLEAGGSLSDLCIDHDMPSHEASTSCDACRLVHSVALPCAPLVAPDRVRIVLEALVIPPGDLFVDARFVPYRAARAPPLG